MKIKKRMRLCYIADAQSVHTQWLVHHFTSLGHQVFLLSNNPIPDVFTEQNLTTFYLHGHGFDDMSKETTIHPRIDHQLNRAAYLWGILYALRLGYGFPTPVGYRPPFLPKRENRYILNLERCALEARKILEQIQPDLVHGHFLTNHGFVAARTGFRPLVVSAWGSDVLLRPQDSFIVQMILRYVLRTADLITSDAETMTHVMIKHGADPCKVITFHWGIDTDIFHHDEGNKKENDRKIIFSSRMLEHVYNLELLLRAIPLVKDRVPRLKVLISGKGSLKEPLEELSRQLKVDTIVSFLGWLPVEELARHYRETDIYISVPFSDSTSVSLLEAMASGAFPIVSDLPGNREWIKDSENGFLISTDDPRVLADRIIRAFNDKALRISAAEKNLKIVSERASSQATIMLLENHYLSLLVDRKGQ